MIERVVESWLNSASEKAFQIPFCHVLTHKGFTVLHMTRHDPIEMGKDIIAIAPDGTPCAFQLKGIHGKRLSKEQWRQNLVPQVRELVLQAITHPAIDSKKHHRSYLVLNGDLEEEASLAIEQFNESLLRTGGSAEQRLDVIVRGQLYRDFISLGENLWPSELQDMKTLLELYLDSGEGRLSKEKAARLLEASLPLVTVKGHKAPSKAECRRAIAGAAIICALATSGFQKTQNHAALFEAWTMYAAHVLCLAERRNLAKKYWKDAFELALESIRLSLEGLCEEIMEHGHDVRIDSFTDVPFYRIRTTYLSGLLAVLGLWRRSDGVPATEKDEFIHRFLMKNMAGLQLWGEYAVPQLLATYWYYEQTVATHAPTDFLVSILRDLTTLGQHRKGLQLPGPHCDPEEFVFESLVRSPSERRHNFRDGSFSMEAILHLFVRTNRKQLMRLLWPDISRVKRKIFSPESLADYYRWHIARGETMDDLVEPTASWARLRTEAGEAGGLGLPRLIKRSCLFYLAFLVVYPHRLDGSGVRWLDSQFNRCGAV